MRPIRPNRFPILGVVLALAAALPAADGHEMRPAYLELCEGQDENTWEMTWKVPARGPDMRLALDVRLPEGSEWTTLPARQYTGDAFIDRGTFTRAGGLNGEEIYIEGLLSTFTDAMVQIHRRDGSLQSARLEPSAPSLRVEARPDPAALPRLYFGWGLEYLKGGWDHLAMVVGLLLLAGSLSRFALSFLAMMIASFAAAYLKIHGIVAVTPRWTEIMLALALVAVALAILRRRTLPRDAPPLPSERARAIPAGIILGIVSGFAFADGMAASGTGSTGLVETFAFLGAIGLGLSALALALAGLFHLFAKRKPARIPPAGRSSALGIHLRFYQVASYLLGLAGVFTTLQRW